MRRIIFFVVVFFLIALVSCSPAPVSTSSGKTSSETSQTGTTQIPETPLQINFPNTTTYTTTQSYVEISGTTIAGALITINGKKIIADESGEFKETVAVSKDSLSINIEAVAEGYSPISKTLTIIKAPTPVLSVENLKAFGDRSLLKVEGKLTNIGDEPLTDLVIVLNFLSPSGEILKTEKRLLEADSIDPGASSPFQYVTSEVTGTASCKISFEKMSGERVLSRPEKAICDISFISTPSSSVSEASGYPPVETTTEVRNPWLLSDEQIMEAMQIGKSLQLTEDSYYKFEKDHYFQYVEGTQVPKSELTVGTPYFSILMKACLFQREYKNYSFTEAKNDALERSKVLSFSVIVYGASVDFCEYLEAVLLLSDGTALHPINQFVPSVADTSSSWPHYPAYKAACFWDFDTSQIGRNDTVTFVLIRELGEQRAVIDLSKYK